MKEDNTILLQLRSRDEEGAVSSSIMISFIIERSKIEAHCTSLLWQASKQANDQMTYILCWLYSICNVPLRQERPYHSDSTASRLLSEVKHCRARLVLRWGTTLESLVLFFCSILLSIHCRFQFQPRPVYFPFARL